MKINKSAKTPPAQSVSTVIMRTPAPYRETRPLFLVPARPMKDEWKMRPYLGVLPLDFSARNSAFSAPRICTVDAGHWRHNNNKDTHKHGHMDTHKYGHAQVWTQRQEHTAIWRCGHMGTQTHRHTNTHARARIDHDVSRTTLGNFPAPPHHAHSIVPTSSPTLARFVNEPAWEMSRAATESPISAPRLGATTAILLPMYVDRFRRYSPSDTSLFRRTSHSSNSVAGHHISIPTWAMGFTCCACV